MGRSTRLKVGVCCAAWLLTSLAAAAPSVRLVMVRGAGTAACVDDLALKSAVVARLGYDPFAAEQRWTLLLRLSRRDESLVGSVELIDEHGESRGERELATARGACDEMTRALALSISLAIDPEHAARGTAPPSSGEFAPAVAPVEPEPLPAPPMKPAKAASAAPAPMRAPQPVGSEPVAVSATLAGLWMSGIAPTSAWGALLELQAKRGHWAAGLGGRWASAPEANVADGARLRASVAAAQLDGCFNPGVVELCALAILGATWARASQIDDPRTDRGLFAAAGARAGLVAPLSASVSLLAQGEGLVVAAPIEPRVDEATIWTAPRISAGFALGLRAHFW